MRQALVVGGSAIVRFAVEQRLVGQGFGCVDMVGDLADAARITGEERFDLVIVLGVDRPMSCDELLAATAGFDAPILVAGKDPLQAIGCLAADAELPAFEKREPTHRRLAA